MIYGYARVSTVVSTHSRPKAAAHATQQAPPATKSFNTQPPEGGCIDECHFCLPLNSFNTQPPEGGCAGWASPKHFNTVSTHSRPKAAAKYFLGRFSPDFEFQHTAARRRLRSLNGDNRRNLLFQHTAARRRLPAGINTPVSVPWFQHTAARRRLRSAAGLPKATSNPWFQHTAARRRLRSAAHNTLWLLGFNTQPPEGGCACFLSSSK